MTPITVNELFALLQKLITKNIQNGDLPCYIYPEGGYDILEKGEVRIEQAERIQNLRSRTYKETELPKRLQIG